MTRSKDLLSERVAQWAAERDENSVGEHALRGWALREALERRGASSSPHLVEIIDRHAGTISTHSIPQLVDHAMRAWTQLLNDLDREENNLEHVRRQTRDVFFCLLETLLVLDEFGESIEPELADRVFNAVINDLYVFEPLADVAAEVARPGRLGAGLTDLFCGGVSRMFDAAPSTARQDAPATVSVDEFVSIDALLRQAAAGKPLTPAAIASRLTEIDWCYLRWIAQRIKLQLNVATRELRLDVFEGDFAAKPARSLALDGWEFRLGALGSTIIRAGGAILRLPERLSAPLNLQVRQSAKSEWLDLYARTPPAREA